MNHPKRYGILPLLLVSSFLTAALLTGCMNTPLAAQLVSKKQTSRTAAETTAAENAAAKAADAPAEKEKAGGPGAGTVNNIHFLEVGDTAPDFTASLVGGDLFRLADYSDKVVLLNFWATWCPYCIVEMPAFEKLEEDQIPGLKIVLVNCMEEKPVVDRYVETEKCSSSVAYDETGEICFAYPTYGIPYTVIIDRGTVAATFSGAKDWETQYKLYRAAVDKCLD